MSKKAKQFLKIAVPLFLGIFLIGYSYNKFTPEQINEIGNHFRQADYTFVIISAVFGILSNLSRAARWSYLLRPLGYQTKYTNNVMAVYITYLMNLFIPRSGEVSRAVVLDKYENVPFEKAFGTVISERIADAIVLLFFIGTTVVFQFPLLSTYFAEIIDLTQFYYLLAIALTVSILAFYIVFISNSFLGKKVRKFIIGLKEGVFSIFKMKNKVGFIAHSLFIWSMYFGMFYIMIYCLPETSEIPLSAILSSFVVGGITITLTNGGFGSYPFVLAGFLLLYGVPETTGTAFGWLVWSTQTITTVIFGSLSFLFLPIFNRKK